MEHLIDSNKSTPKGNCGGVMVSRLLVKSVAMTMAVVGMTAMMVILEMTVIAAMVVIYILDKSSVFFEQIFVIFRKSVFPIIAHICMVNSFSELHHKSTDSGLDLQAVPNQMMSD